MNANEISQDRTRCLWCGRLTVIIWVHGHGQCRLCGTNIDECCRGETVSCDRFQEQAGQMAGGRRK